MWAGTRAHIIYIYLSVSGCLPPALPERGSLPSAAGPQIINAHRDSLCQLFLPKAVCRSGDLMQFAKHFHRLELARENFAHCASENIPELTFATKTLILNQYLAEIIKAKTQVSE